MLITIVSKLNQKSTWTGLAAVGYGLFTFDPAAIISGLGLILVNA